MPTLRFHGLSVPVLRSVSSRLTPKLAQIVGCAPDWFVYEAVQSTFVSHEGHEVSRPPIFVDLLWFSRGQETQDKVAACVTEVVKQELQEGKADAASGASADVDVTVIATAIQKPDYYENGEHFG